MLTPLSFVSHKIKKKTKSHLIKHSNKIGSISPPNVENLLSFLFFFKEMSKHEQ